MGQGRLGKEPRSADDSGATGAVLSLKLKDQPAAERPRERLRDKGPESLSPGELVAILLRTGLKGANVVEIGKQLVQRHGSLNALARASWKELAKEPGIG